MWHVGWATYSRCHTEECAKLTARGAGCLQLAYNKVRKMLLPRTWVWACDMREERCAIAAATRFVIYTAVYH